MHAQSRLLSAFLLVTLASLTFPVIAPAAAAESLPAVEIRDGARWIGTELLPPLPSDPAQRDAALQRVLELNQHRAQVSKGVDARTPQYAPTMLPVFVDRPQHETGLAAGHMPKVPGLLTGWDAITDDGTYPASADIAVGPNHVVVAAGGQFAVYDKCGILRDGGDVQTYFFFPASIEFYSPQVLYDAWENRWVMAFVGNTFLGFAKVFVFVSNESNPESGWYYYQFDLDEDGEYPDDIRIAIDPLAFYLTSDQFDFAGDVFKWVTMHLEDKSVLYSNGPLTPGFIDFQAPGVRPAQPRSYDGQMYFVSSEASGGTDYTFWTIRDPLGVPSLSVSIISSINSYAPPPNAQQMDFTYLETGDARIQDAVYFAGLMHTVQGIDRLGEPFIRTKVFDPATPSEIQGAGSDTNGFAAGIDVDELGVTTVARLTSTTSSFPAVGYLLRQQSQLLEAGTVRSGNSNVHGGGSGTDVSPYQLANYTGVALDPTDRRTVWVHGAYGSNSPLNSWGSAVGAVSSFAEAQLQAAASPLAIAGPAGGPFDNDAFTITLVNNGGTTANWKLDAIPAWLYPGASTGQLPPGAFAEISFHLNDAAKALGPGRHQASVDFSNCTGAGTPSAVVTIGIADDLDCDASMVDLRPSGASSTSGAFGSAGLFVTAMNDFDLCAIGVDHDFFNLAEEVLVQVYEADGFVRGTLVSQASGVAISTGMNEHFVAISGQLQACQDYEIVVAPSAIGTWRTWNSPAVPYDASGVVRVRSGSVLGSPTNQVIGVSVFGTSSSCGTLADLDPGSALYSTSTPAVDGIRLTPTQDVRTCSIGLDADLTPGTKVAAIVTGPAGLVGLGSSVVAASGFMVHSIPLNAFLSAGQSYEVLLNFEETGSWRYYSSMEFSAPASIPPFEVEPSLISGTPAVRMAHVTIEWDVPFGGQSYDLAKPGGGLPPPFSNGAGPLDAGVVVEFSQDNEVFGAGVMADIAAGQAIMATAYQLDATGARGAVVGQGSTLSRGAGSQWHDVPLPFSATPGQQYDVAISSPNVNDYRYWDDSSGLPFVGSGDVTVVVGEVGGSPGVGELIHTRLHMCHDPSGSAVNERLPVTLFLNPIWPNPASGSVTLAFMIGESGVADMTIYDVRGRRVADVFRGQPVGFGKRSLQFDVSRLPSGVYFVKLQTSAGSISRKMVVRN